VLAWQVLDGSDATYADAPRRTGIQMRVCDAQAQMQYRSLCNYAVFTGGFERSSLRLTDMATNRVEAPWRAAPSSCPRA
jgi:hypothetical protein